MSNIDLLQQKTYTLYLNSNDKVSGANNNANFQVNWNDFLPLEFSLYKLAFSFQTTGGYYADPTPPAVRSLVYSSARLVMDFQGRSFSFDTNTLGPSLTVGYVQRDIQVLGGGANTLSCFYLQNAPKTIMRPNQNLLNIRLYNTSNTTTLMTDNYNNFSTVITNTTTATNIITVNSTTNLYVGQSVIISGTTFGGLATGTYTIASVPSSTTLTLTGVSGLTTASGTMTLTTNNIYSDMPSWSIILEFIPVEGSNISSVKSLGL